MDPADLYISVDIEADGPIPGPYSMLALGLCVAGRFDGNTYERRNPTNETFYVELAPISTTFSEEALSVSKLNRAELIRSGVPPREAMGQAAEWITAVTSADRPVICAYPAAFDWLFLYWYLERFAAEANPVGFSSCLDMKSIYATKAKVPFEYAGLDDLPQGLVSERPHTHNALDDALEQAEIFSKLFTWKG
jgi:hypothetical protein